jgi:Helicase associated domain (HA2)
MVNESNQLKSGDVKQFDFEDTIEESKYLSITPLGRLLVNLPVEVIIGKMLVLATVPFYSLFFLTAR